MRPVGSQGIVGNWKSRWTCMSFQEEMVTTEIEPNTQATTLISFISVFAPLYFFYFLSSLLIFLVTYSLISFLSRPLLSCILYSVETETGNRVLLAKELSGRVQREQSTKYVQKEQPAIMNNIPCMHTINLNIFHWRTSIQQWKQYLPITQSERLMEVWVAISLSVS